VIIEQDWKFMNLSSVTFCFIKGLIFLNVNVTSRFKPDFTASATVMTDKTAMSLQWSLQSLFHLPWLAAATQKGYALALSEYSASNSEMNVILFSLQFHFCLDFF
jgi:hypothetical protein